jgi:hypothetical protein
MVEDSLIASRAGTRLRITIVSNVDDSGRFSFSALKNGSTSVVSPAQASIHPRMRLNSPARRQVISIGAGLMHKAEHYRKEANRCADLAKTEQLDFLREIYRKAAVRYALMAEEAEMAGPGSGQDGVSLWRRADRLLALTR